MRSARSDDPCPPTANVVVDRLRALCRVPPSLPAAPMPVRECGRPVARLCPLDLPPRATHAEHKPACLCLCQKVRAPQPVSRWVGQASAVYGATAVWWLWMCSQVCSGGGVGQESGPGVMETGRDVDCRRQPGMQVSFLSGGPNSHREDNRLERDDYHIIVRAIMEWFWRAQRATRLSWQVAGWLRANPRRRRS